jgi:2-polyprenyl-6-methoxyphenol hydroxylase-like FAD-dependent oxidoreductase
MCLPPAAETRAANGLSIAIVGGGPSGLAAAHWMLSLDAVRKVTLIEKEPLQGLAEGAGAYPIALGARAKEALAPLPGDPWNEIAKRGRQAGSYVSSNRGSIREGLWASLSQVHGASGRLDALFGNAVQTFNVTSRTLALRCGKEVPYDCLVIADGVNSESVEQLGIPRLLPARFGAKCVIKSAILPLMPDGSAPGVLTIGRPGGPHTARKDNAMLIAFPRHPESVFALLKYHYSAGRNPFGVSSVSGLREVLTRLEGINISAARQAACATYFRSLDDALLQNLLDANPRCYWFPSPPFPCGALHRFVFNLGAGVFESAEARRRTGE